MAEHSEQDKDESQEIDLADLQDQLDALKLENAALKARDADILSHILDEDEEDERPRAFRHAIVETIQERFIEFALLVIFWLVGITLRFLGGPLEQMPWLSPSDSHHPIENRNDAKDH